MFKKVIALFLSLVMIFSITSNTFCAFAKDLVFSDVSINPQDAPYIDGNGDYWRKSNGEYICFKTDFDKMIEYFQEQMLNRQSKIVYYFATNEKKYQYKYEKESDYDSAFNVAKDLFNEVFSDIFKYEYKNNNASVGEYLYNNISLTTYTYGCNIFTSAMDTPYGDNDRYFTFKIEIGNLSYNTNVEQEKAIKNFSEFFKENYLKDVNSDYLKVKTIYDFIVRNTDYDYDVSSGKYNSDSERFLNSHSAYGAIFGLLDENDLDLSVKTTATGEKVSVKYNQGLAVCEGYSNLFYYLCRDNDIKCHIVEGDYNSDYVNKKDPHQWNYVYLDDGAGDGYKWFQVDTTFASQQSFKEIDFNCYDYFLCGTENIKFGYMNHQQPYKIGEIASRPQLYNWYIEENIPSLKDYQFILTDLSSVENLEVSNIIIQRSTNYNENSEDKYSFILADCNGMSLIIKDEQGNVEYKSVNGFEYSGYQSAFRIYIPYLLDKEYQSDIVRATDCGDYKIEIHGKNSSKCGYDFKIVPLDMSINSNYDIDNTNIQTHASYTGNVLEPKIKIIDGYGNELVNGYDFDLVIASNGIECDIEDIGTYQVSINFKGNYSGKYPFEFSVGKINLNEINYTVDSIQYYPDGFLKSQGYNDFEDYVTKNIYSQPSKVGKKYLYASQDYSVSVDTKQQIITLTGLPGSENVLENSTLTAQYQLKKLDLSQFDNYVADPSANYVYTGSVIVPNTLAWLDSNFERGVDYEIVSYSNNTNSGIAYVTIKGIGNCTGKAKMRYQITKAPISSAKVTYSTKSNTVSYSVKFNGNTLVKGTDYDEKITITSNGYKITLTGKGNFNGSLTVNVVNKVYTPTKSNNTVKLSTSSYTYNGSNKTPTVILVNSNGKTVSTYFYTVKYSSNKNVGIGKVTVTFRNGYSGTITKTFTIKPKATSISSLKGKSKGFTVKWKKQSTQTTGYQIQYSTSSKFKNAKTVTVSKNSTTSKTVSNLSKKKKYYVRLRTYKTVNGKKYYSSWSSSKSVYTK